MMTSTEKIRENRLRRMAQRQGLTLQKSRRRDPRALDYGTYSLIDTNNTTPTTSNTMTIEEVETYLRGPMEIRISRDPLDDMTFGGDDRPIVQWITYGTIRGWHLYLAWDDDSYNLGGRESYSDEEVRAMANSHLGWG